MVFVDIILLVTALGNFNQGIQDDHEVELADVLFLRIAFIAARLNQYRARSPALEIIAKTAWRIGIVIFGHTLRDKLLKHTIHSYRDLHGTSPYVVNIPRLVVRR